MRFLDKLSHSNTKIDVGQNDGDLLISISHIKGSDWIDATLTKEQGLDLAIEILKRVQ